MTANASLICRVDAESLKLKLSRDDLFGEYGWRKDKYAHADMTDIWVRYNMPENIGEHFNDEHSSVWYPVIRELPEIISISADLMAFIAGERLGGILITKLPPGGEIKPHIDKGWHAEYYSKYYVAIKNQKGAKLCFEDGCVEPEEGEVYEFRNDVPHWVINESGEDRIAMIICIRSILGAISEHFSQV